MTEDKNTSKFKTYADKLRSADRDARLTLVAVIAIVAVWILCGFGLSGSDVYGLGIPLWVLGGTFGTWIFAVVVAVCLAKWGFEDFELDDDNEGEAK